MSTIDLRCEDAGQPALNKVWRGGLDVAVLPLAGESRQALAAVVVLRAVPSVEAAVVPSCAHAGGDGEVREPA